MNTQPWVTVARREIMAKLTDRAFMVGTVVSLAMIAGFMVFQTLWSERTQTHTVAVLAADRPMAEQIAHGAHALDDKVEVTVTEVADPEAARAAVMAGDADVWLHRDKGSWLLTGKDDVDSSLTQAATTIVRQSVTATNAQAAGTDLTAIERGATLQTSLLIGDADQQGFADAMGFVLAFLFYMASLGFGLTIAGSVVEEKASRIVEIIATKIPIRQLLIGKVVGNTVLAVAQMAIYVAIGLIGLSFTKYSSMLPGASAGLGWFLGYFLIGFLLIACLWAVVGALATRSEDLQQTSMPLSMLMMAIFFASFLAKGTVLTVLSFVPPFSAVLMPIRVLQGTAAWWEPVVALVLLLVTAAFVVGAAERLYRRSLLQTQGRLTIRQAWAVAE